MAVRRTGILSTPSVGTNLGQQIKQERQAREEASAINKALEATGEAFNPRTQVVTGTTEQFQAIPQQYQEWQQQVAEINQRNITPTLSIENGNIKLMGTKTALSLNATQNLINNFNEKFNETMGINSPDVQAFVAELNVQAQQDAKDEVQDIITKQAYNWNDQQLADYKYTQQTVRDASPSQSTNLIKAYKDGKIESMTYSDWVDYINSLSRDEEELLLGRASRSTDPYLHAIWQIATRGGDDLSYDMSKPDGPVIGEGKVTYDIRDFGERVATGLETGGLRAASDFQGLLTGAQNVGSVAAAILPAITGDEQALSRINQDMAERNEYINNFRSELLRETKENERLSPVASTLGSFSYDIAKFIGESILAGGAIEGVGAVRAATTGGRNAAEGFRLMNIGDRISKPIIKGAEDAAKLGAEGVYTQTLEKLVGNPILQRLATSSVGKNIGAAAQKLAQLYANSAVGLGILLSTTGGRWATRVGAEIIEDIIQTYADRLITGGGLEEDQKDRFKFTTKDFQNSAIGTIAVKSVFGIGGAAIRGLGRRILNAREARKIGKKIKLDGVFKTATEANEQAQVIRQVANGQGTIDEVSSDGVMTVTANGTKHKLDKINIADLKDIDLSKNQRLKNTYDDYIAKKTATEPDQPTSLATERATDPNRSRKIYSVGEVEEGREVYLSKKAAEDAANGRKITTTTVTDSHIEVDNGAYRYRTNELPTIRAADLPDSSSAVWDKAPVATQIKDNKTFLKLLKNPSPITNLSKFKDQIASLYSYARNRIDDIVEKANALAVRKGISPEDLTHHFDAIMEAERRGLLIRGGTYVPSANGRIVLDQDIINFYNNTIEPFMRPLREAGYKEAGVQVTARQGYLPQIPSGLTADLFPEPTIKQYSLFKKNYGLIAHDNGVFDPERISGNLDERLDYFTRQMINESQGDHGWLFQRMQDAFLNNEPLTVQQAVAELKVEKEAYAKAVKSPEMAKLNNTLTDIEPKNPSESLQSEKGFNEFKKQIETSAEKENLWQKNFDAYHSDEYKKLVDRDSRFFDKQGAKEGVKVTRQPLTTFAQNSDVMKSFEAGSLGNLYDNGGALTLEPATFASEISERIAANSTTQGIYDACNWAVEAFGLARSGAGAQKKAAELVQVVFESIEDGNFVSGVTTTALSEKLRKEGTRMLRLYLAQIDPKSASKATQKFINNFLYQNTFYRAFLEDNKITKGITKAVNTIIGARYNAIMAFNYKNALLQLTELSRLYTMNGWGSANKTLKNLISNKDGLGDLTDRWLRILAPDSLRSYMEGDLEKASTVMDALKKQGNDYVVEFKEGVDALATGAIEGAEGIKNRVLLAGILNKGIADGLDPESVEFSQYVRRRWEREALAADAMGKLAASNNPFVRLSTMFMSFPIREAEMHWHNIIDAKNEKGVLGAVSYLARVFGFQGAMALVMAPLGYSAMSLLGFDPLGVTENNYYGIDEDKMTLADRLLFANNPLFAGAILSAIPDMYFKYRSAYENAKEAYEFEHPGEEYEGGLLGLQAPETNPLSDLLDQALGYVPASNAVRRVGQMGELLSQGFSQSASGNLQYEAPTDPIDIIKGFIFGKSATERGREYLQRPDILGGVGRAISTGNIGELTQEVGRFGRQFTDGSFREFDPATTDYSDWFSGDRGDSQQMTTALYYFQDQADQVRDRYNDRFNRARSDDERTQVRNAAENELSELADEMRFLVEAYNSKHPEGIPPRTANWIEGILEPPASFEIQQEGYENYNTGVGRYANANIPSSRGMVGPTESTPDREISRATNFALRNAASNLYGASNEAPAVIKSVFNSELKSLHDQAKARVNALYDRIDNSSKSEKNRLYKEIESIQKEYLKSFDAVYRPIVQVYGTNMLNNSSVEEAMRSALSQMIPSSSYKVDKKGKRIYQSTPYMTADIGKWLQARYSDIRKSGGATDESASATITRIRNLLNEGKEATAKAEARKLINRVNQNRTSVSASDLQWVIDVKNR